MSNEIIQSVAYDNYDDLNISTSYFHKSSFYYFEYYLMMELPRIRYFFVLGNKLGVGTRVRQVLKIASNPCWVSKLIFTIIKKIKYSILIYNYSYKKPNAWLLYITMIINSFEKSNIHLKLLAFS
jgi:hypothetical protein